MMGLLTPKSEETREWVDRQVHIYRTADEGHYAFRAYVKGEAAKEAWGHTMDAAFNNLIRKHGDQNGQEMQNL